MMDDYKRDTCGSCHALIIWAVTAKSLRRIPVDYEPSDKGNIRLEGPTSSPPLAHTLSIGEQFGKTGLHLSHFATCPHAAQHRRRS